MSNVINMNEHKPRLSGEAKCLACGHHWEATSPLGVVDLECPECGTFKGVYMSICIPEFYLECDCGNEFFFVTPDGYLCAKCGSSPEF